MNPFWQGFGRGGIWGNMVTLPPGALIVAWAGHVAVGALILVLWLVVCVIYIQFR